MKIILTGAAGFIGFLLMQKLLSQNHEVFYIDSLNDYYDPSLKEKRLERLQEEKGCGPWGRLNGIDVVCLRYFNVYGPNQRFDAYGNVIPIFAFQLLRGETLTIFGDGEQTRDFVNVQDVVQANIKAALAKGISGAFNIGSGDRITINNLVELMREITGIEPTVRFGPPRPGDVRDSLADISKARDAFGFEPVVAMGEGLKEYFAWAEAEMKSQS